MNLEEYKMPLGKRKNNINVYETKELIERRQELLDRITKSDTYLPDSILHDDLDSGMLDYVKENFVVISDGEQIPIIPKILTIQRWGEISNTWTFNDEDGNIKVPFISLVRKPDVQPGTHPSIQRTIPDRATFYYEKVPTWNGTQLGADIYKIPQPIAIDITYEVTIVCNKFRDVNRFNKIVLQKFASRQSYTTIKGHYVPLILNSNNDSSPIDSIDGRRFYIQTYEFTMMGFLIDSDEFEVKPAISRLIILNEFINTKTIDKKIYNNPVETIITKFIGNGIQTSFGVGESIDILFYVSINGLVQERGVNFFHIVGTSKISFSSPPDVNSVILVSYYASKNNPLFDIDGRPIIIDSEYYLYDGSTLDYLTTYNINSIIYIEINGIIDEEDHGYSIIGENMIRLLDSPVVGTTIGVCYMHY
jgi:hypothetical protein